MINLLKGLLLIVLIIAGIIYWPKYNSEYKLTEKFSAVESEFKQITSKQIEKIQEQKEATNEQTIEIKVGKLGIPKIADTPKMKVASEYGETWNVYENQHQNFTLTFSDSSGGYIAGKGRKIFGATIGKTTYNDLLQKLGNPLTQIRKGHVMYELSSNQSNEQLVYYIEGYYVTFFFDLHNQNKLRSVQYIKKNVEMNKKGFYGQGTAKLRDGYEKLMVELINESRVEFGLKPLIYDKGLTAEARQHSQDMIDHHYFSHTGSDGSQPHNRMIAAGYNEQMYAENIASGQYSSIFAHEGLMNSMGHRKNILNTDLTHVGVGVAFDANNVPYYTINFYKPF
ncbi:CAP domain-containing protein [Rummeliibacillus sp. JY-2-4R]